MVIYAELYGTRIRQWSSSFIDEYMEIEIPENHPILHSLDNTIYHYLDGKVVEVNNDEYLLEEMKKSKSEEMSRICGEKITGEFDVDGAHYSYSQEKQINFQDTYQLFLNNMITEITWNAYVDGEKKRISLNKEGFQKVYLSGVKHKIDCLSKLNDGLYPLIRNAKTKEEIDEISWDTPVEIVETEISTSKTLERKVTGVENDVNAQQVRNAQMEMIILDVADIALSGGF